MEIKVNTYDDEIVFSNDAERGYGVYYERGNSKNDFSVTMNVSLLLSLSDQDFREIQNWIENNLEIAVAIKLKSRADEIQKQKEKSKERTAYLEKLQEEQRIEREKGYIYLLGSEVGKYKIGRTNNLEKRINHFVVKLPLKTWLVHSFRTNLQTKAENYLHFYFEEKQITGEWFDLSDNDIELIKSINDYSIDHILEKYQTRKVIRK